MNDININKEAKQFLGYEDVRKMRNNKTSKHFYNDYTLRTKNKIQIIEDVNNIKMFNKIKTLLSNIQDLKALNFIKDFYGLFNESIYSYNLLNVLSVIYRNKVAPEYSTGDWAVLSYNEKTALLKKSFDIFKNLEYRDRVLKSIIIKDWSDISRYLLNEDKLIVYLLNHPYLFEKPVQIPSQIFPDMQKSR